MTGMMRMITVEMGNDWNDENDNSDFEILLYFKVAIVGE